ncbi:MAG: nucleic acid-binding protein [Epulopiscium sp. Nuni2H_MBin003]|nr:MAG: nucleic acid-binding protein [Epulopiscium sp. Nuni2H_MBin003]
MRKVPLRKCTGCTNMKDKKELIRVVKNTQGEYSIDFSGKQAGRGAYICKDYNCLKLAIKNRGLERSFKSAVSKEIYDKLLSEYKENE